MAQFDPHWNVPFAEQFGRFERAAAQGQREAQALGTALKEVRDMGNTPELIKVLSEANDPICWFFAGELFDLMSLQRYQLVKQSAEAGCSWAQVAYAEMARNGNEFVVREKDLRLVFLEKAADQANPKALELLGDWALTRAGGWNYDKALDLYLTGAELGWKNCMQSSVDLLRRREQWTTAARWAAEGDSGLFWFLLGNVREWVEEDEESWDQVCYAVGAGLYWHDQGKERWDSDKAKNNAFSEKCLDYFCECCDLQQESLVTFLVFWKKNVGVKELGVMIGKMVWEQRAETVGKTIFLK
jgi:hypothetical protein